MKITKLKEVRGKEEPFSVIERNNYLYDPNRGILQHQGVDEQDVEFFAESELCDVSSLSQYVKQLNDKSIN